MCLGLARTHKTYLSSGANHWGFDDELRAHAWPQYGLEDLNLREILGCDEMKYMQALGKEGNGVGFCRNGGHRCR